MIFLTRQLARILGLLFVVVGIGGFFSSGFIGFIRTDIMLNLFHIVLGILGVASARTYRYSKHWLYGGGLLLAAFGVLILVNGSVFNVLSTNPTGAIAYICFGIGMLATGSLLRPKKL